MWDFSWGNSGARGLLVGKFKCSWDFAHVRIFDVGFEVGFFTLKWDFFKIFRTLPSVSFIKLIVAAFSQYTLKYMYTSQ